MKNTNTSPVIKNKTARIFHKIMLIAMLHNTFVAPCQTIVIDYFSLQKPRHYSGAVLNSHEVMSPEMQRNTESVIPAQITEPAISYSVSNGYTTTPQLRNTITHASFDADIKEGTIGVNSEHPLDSPNDNLFKFNIEGLVSPQSKVYLTYDLYGVQDASAVSRSINDRLSTGGHIVKYQASWTTQKEEIDGAWLQPGENKILFTIAKGASYQYKIRNIKIEVDNNTSKALNSLMIYQPAINYTHNNQMYIKGFVKNAAPDSKVYIEDNLVSIHNGAFEGTITLTEAIKNRHFIVVKAMDDKGLVGQEIIMLDNIAEADKLFPIEENLLSASTYFKAGIAGNIAVDGASLQLNDNALKADKNITAMRLRGIDVPPMSSGMINVTKGATAYRFLPDGTVFDEPVSLSLAYDEKLIPPGHNAKEIHTYYFNTDSKAWLPVVRDSVIEKDMMIISKTNHFTDYINGIIQTPESPETAAFTPTMMSDIKAADPSAEMTIISPPEVSQKGDANISYPIKIPAGIRGMQPSLTVQYSNEGGNGWIGQGWGLNIPAISIDTKWGVPLLDDTFETEVYTLAGEQLMYPKIEVGEDTGIYDDWMPNRHYGESGTYNTEPRHRMADLMFTPRKQGSFATIQRMGNSPSNYYWKVTATDGTISWYGGKTGVITKAVLKRGGKIVYWALYMTEDVYGNYIKYDYYQNQLESGDLNQVNANLKDGWVFLPQTISYTGHGTSDGFGYKVNFKTTTSIKDDATINARLGVKQVDAYLLSEIEVINLKSETQHLIRKYKFGYKPHGGRFKKAQLISLGEYVKDENNNDKEFYTHKFEYYNDIPTTGNNVFFSAGVDVNVCNDDYEEAPDNPPAPVDPVSRCYKMTFPIPLTNIMYRYNMTFGVSIPFTGECPFVPYRIKRFYYGLGTGSTNYPAPSPNNNLYVTHFDGTNVVNQCQGGGFFHPVNPALPGVLESWLGTTFSAMPISDFVVSNHTNVVMANGPAQDNYNILLGVSFLSALDNINFGCKMESAQANSMTYTISPIDSKLSHYIYSGTGVSAAVTLGGTPLGNFNFQTGLNAFIAAVHGQYPNAEITTEGFNVIITIPSTTANLGAVSMNVGGTNHSFDRCEKKPNQDRPESKPAFGIEDAREKLFNAAYGTKDKPATARTANDNTATYVFNNGYPIGPQECPSFLNTEFIVQGIIPSFDSSSGILGSTLTESLGASFYIGGGIGCKPHTKSITFGKQWTASKDKSTARIGMADINGDGLDDMVIRQIDLTGAKLFYKPHKIERTYNEEGEEVITHSFGAKKPIIGMNNFYKSTGSSKSRNLQVTFGVSKVGGFIGRDKAESEATTNVYFTDGNGDGLTDIVQNGVVYFNRLDDNGNPNFTLDSAETENLVIKAKPMQIDEPAPPPTEVTIPDYDVVKVWEAPADGAIRIKGDISVQDATKQTLVSIEMRKGALSPPLSCYEAETCLSQIPMIDKRYGYQGYFKGVTFNGCHFYPFRTVNMTIEGNTFNLPLNAYLTHYDNGLTDLCSASSIQNLGFKPQIEAWLLSTNGPLSPYLDANSYLFALNKSDYNISFAGKTMNFGLFHFQSNSYINNYSTNYVLESAPSNAISGVVGPDTMSRGLYYAKNNNPIVVNGNIVLDGHYPYPILYDSMLPLKNALEQAIGGTVTFETHSYYTGIPMNSDPCLSLKIKVENPNVPLGTITIDGQTFNFNACTQDRLPKDTYPFGITLKSESNEKGFDKYTLAKDKDKLIWYDENDMVVSDIKKLSLLKPYNAIADSQDYQIANNIFNSNDRNANHGNQAIPANSKYRSINPSNCEDTPNELCPLYYTTLGGASNPSSIDNLLIENGSTLCNTSNLPLYVKKGDRIYFRVHANETANPEVTWNPKVEYTDTTMAAATEQDGQLLYNTSYSDGFLLSRYEPVIVPDGGYDPANGNAYPATATISWTPKQIINPSDDVIFEIHRIKTTDHNNGSDNSTDDVIYRRICKAGQSTTVSTALTAGLGEVNLLSSNTNMASNLAGSDVTNSNQFYFKVFSSSNVKWKDYKWGPKITCVTQQPMIGDAGTSEGTLTSTTELYPNVDYSIYKSYPCSPKYTLFNTSGIGANDLEIKPFMNDIYTEDKDVHFWFVVKNNGKVIAKKKFTRERQSSFPYNYENSWDVGSNAIPLGTLTGSNIEIGFYFDDSTLLDDQISNAAKLIGSTEAVKIFYNNNNSSVTVPADKLNVYHKPNPKFGPMLRQWGQFMYSPGLVTGATVTPYGNLIKEDALRFTTVQLEAIQDIVENHLPAENTPVDGIEAALENFDINYGGVLNSLPLLVANPSKKMVDNQLSEKWIGQQDNCFASETGSKAARMEELELDGFDPEPYDFQLMLDTGAYAINKKTKGRSKNLSAGASVEVGAGFNVGLNGSKTVDAFSKSVTDYVDFNGDRYPDIVSSEYIQFTESTGGLKDKIIRTGNISESSSSSKGFGASGSYSKGGDQDGAGGFRFIGFKGNSGGGISGNFSKGDSKTGSFWADMNGDGLSDLIERVGTDVKVKLSTGTIGTDSGYTWLTNKFPFDNKTENRSAGGGVNKWNGSFEAGVSVTSGWNSTEGMLIDMNGDGLMDYLSTSSAQGLEGGMYVMLNQGNNFIDFGQQWSTRNLKRESVVVGNSINLGFTVAMTWPLFGFCIKFPAINIAGTPESVSVNKTMKSIRDFDGDGYPDIVEQDDNNSLKVYSSNIRRTDMLKTVINPLGGSFTIDYKPQPIDYDNPHPKWAMTDIEIYDGYKKLNDGRDKYRKHFVYENGNYDRREREFYGYETVKTVDYNMDEDDKPTTVYRTSVNKYHNDSYFLNGLVKESYVYKGDNENQKFSATENTYEIRKLDQTNSHIDLEADVLPMNYDVGGTEGRRTAVVLLVKTRNLLYELAEDSQITTVTNMEYDNKGRIVKYHNIGNIADASDDYVSEITYHNIATLQAKNIIRIPKSITVSGGSTTYRSRSTIVDSDNGNILVVSAVLDDQNTASTQMQYDDYGNMIKITYPPNLHNESMTYDYEYETTYHKYVTVTKDSYNYTSRTLYNNDFDKVREVTDISGNYMTYKYDKFGRMTEVIAPYEMKEDKKYTIKFEYFPTYQVFESSNYKNCFGSSSDFTPFAITSHYDKQGTEGNDIQTVTFIDGMARVIQIKKDIQLKKSESNYEAMSISGNITFDDFGRVIKVYHPTAQEKGCNDVKYVEYASEFSSSTEYDQIDRTIKTIDADGNMSLTSYSIDTDTDGNMAIKTRSETEQDEDGQFIISESYKNTSGKLISAMNVAPGNDLWTKFSYDHIGQLLNYQDADGLATSYVYDEGGRKKSINHPDNGLTKIQYDNAGHMITAQTANLAGDTTLNEEDRFIKYDYYYNRTIGIKYPDTSSGPNLSNVIYKYGVSGNDKGKVTEQYDASGYQFFKYGMMGEVIYNERVVVGPNIPTRNFKTYFTYDSWNRLISMKYPDNEKVSYKYDYGGNLRSMIGSVDGNDYYYIKAIDYDLYEQRTDVAYGNGTKNHYTYKASTRRLDGLKAMTSSEEVMFNNTYKYDFVGNVTNIINNEGPLSNQFGGSYSHTFKYDTMSRLKEAYGNFEGNSGQASYSNDYQSDYHLEMTYSKTNGIETKTQVHHKNYDMTPYAPNSYANTYKYYTGTHKLERINDPGLGTDEVFNYDLNGNITSRIGNGTDNSMWWDESNRLRVFFNNNTGDMQHYIYDATGQRVLKANTDGESVYNNGSLVTPYSVTVNGYTTYASGFLVIDPQGVYSKHYYAGGERVVSRIGGTDLGIFSTEIPRGTADGEQSADAKLRKEQIADLQRFADKLKLGTVKFKEFKAYSYNEIQQAMKEDDSEATDTQQRAESSSGPIYFYHPDHLGTTTFLTDSNGNAYQFYLNLPFGETMAQQAPLDYYKSPYLFNGKELDEETGMYYRGARYYDPKISIWMSVDPLATNYPNWNPYNYCLQNPINLIDPTGMGPTDTEDECNGVVAPPKKNIYIVIDYKPNPEAKKDLGRDCISFDKSVEENGWHGIYAENLQDADKQLKEYLNGSKADNVVIESHGGYLTWAEPIAPDSTTFFNTDNNAETFITNDDLGNSINGTNTKNQGDVDALISIIGNIKEGGGFVLGTCDTAMNNNFFDNLQTLTGNKVDLYGFCDWFSPEYYPDQYHSDKIIKSNNILNRNFIQDKNWVYGAKLFQGGCPGDPPILLKDVQLNKKGVSPQH